VGGNGVVAEKWSVSAKEAHQWTKHGDTGKLTLRYRLRFRQRAEREGGPFVRF
jgi:hypothetical protein